MHVAKSGDPYLSVTEATRQINDTFEAQFPQLLFHGEISQLTVAASGHLYFSVKDQGAQLSCVMWARTVRTLTFKPSQGVAVRVHGNPNIYPQTGRFQIVVSRLLEDGEGELQRKFLELKDRLQREGFFSVERKRPLPFLPRAVGLVTSRTGAVLHDMMVKLRERFPSMVVYLSETRVQGEGAAQEIASAMRKLDESNLVDVIIVARGGGSLEDLWAFNEESVVKAVFACSVPVVSGVGHETDTTLCDFAADVRAPTPTAAAEMVVPKVTDLLQRVGEFERRLRDFDRWLQPMTQRIDELSLRLDARAAALVAEGKLRIKAAEAKLASIRPDKVIELLRGKIELFHGRLYRMGMASTERLSTAVSQLRERVRRAIPTEKIAHQLILVEGLQGRLFVGAKRGVDDAKGQVMSLALRLDSINPQKVLERGFSIVRVGGKPARSVDDVRRGDAVEISVVDGLIHGTVTDCSKER
ncbi:MAG: Exodeoxyribonuclease large subunit [Pseudomonadota bacterium]|jgi:exodeoxyribonuclease VII large subunit